jgi:cell division septation protein DedD
MTFAAWSQTAPPEKRVCVLPFTDKTESSGIANRVRDGFFGRLALKRFADVKLRELDARLQALPESWRKATPQKLGPALSCDALVYGEILQANNLYVGVYAQLTLQGRIRLVDAATGETLVVGEHTTKFRLGNVPLSLFELAPNAIFNLRNFSDEQGLRAVDDLARNLADTIPDLPTPPSVPTVEAAFVAADTKTGSQPVKFSDPKRSEVPAVASTTPCPKHDCYQVQVASFRNSDEARQAAQQLRAAGFRPKVVLAAQAEQSFHRVMLGPFATFEAAQKTGATIRQRLRFSPMVRFVGR